MGKNMGLKALLIVSIAISLPACTKIEVKKSPKNLLPTRTKKVVNIRQAQVITQPKKAPKKIIGKVIKKVVQSSKLPSNTLMQKKQKPVPLICVEKKKTITTTYFQEGKASYYSSALHGRKTASGAIYHKDKFTAAHKHLPFGTKVRVTNKDNGKSVLVSINDRGPFVKKRIIDLSHCAARELGMLHAGISNIQLEVLP